MTHFSREKWDLDPMGLTCDHSNVSAFPASVSGGAERARGLLRSQTTPNVTNKNQKKALPLRWSRVCPLVSGQALSSSRVESKDSLPGVVVGEGYHLPDDFIAGRRAVERALCSITVAGQRFLCRLVAFPFG